MIVKVDTRESALMQAITDLVATIPIFKSIQLKTETLPIGDIIICENKEDGVEKELLIIERKSVSDLLSSIKDGRYEEQSYRLNGLSHHNHNIVYLIEGDINRVNRFKADNKIEKLTLYSAMFSLNYYKGFSVQRSFSMEETAIMICNMAYKLEKESSAGTKTAFYNNTDKSVVNVGEEHNTDNPEPNEGGGEKDYVNVIKKVKKENITPDNIGEIMLCQIPGVSSVTALAVLDKYKTLYDLIKAIENDDNCLNDVMTTNAKGQKRKINKVTATNIVKFLLKKET